MNSECVNGIDIESSVARLTAGDGAGGSPALKQTKKKAKKEKTDGISMIMIIFMH